MVRKKFIPDVDSVLERRHDNGGDFWATPDGRLLVGGPFSTLESLVTLHELGVKRTHPAVKGSLQLLLDSIREDGRCKVAPKGTVYPCHTANVARILCRFGYAKDARVARAIDQLLGCQHDDGGWRCNKSPMGRSKETDLSNPGVTLFVLDALRFTDRVEGPRVDRATETLLDHWEVRRPLGPCTFGIGTLFMQVEYPFFRYNLFYYVYILSFFARARGDRRYLEAKEALDAKLDDRGRVVIERPNRKLAGMLFCSKGQPSDLATRRYREIEKNHGER